MTNKTFITLMSIPIFLIVLGISMIIIARSQKSHHTISTIPYTNDLQIRRMDGCEYVIFGYNNIGGITHHGACDNPIHSKP